MEPKSPFEVKKVAKIVESKEVDNLVECISTLELSAKEIGQGRNAVVYAAEGTVYENVCLKRIRNKPEVLANTIDEEHKFQIEAKNVGVRTPLSLVSLETQNGIYLIMERVNGPTAAAVASDPRLAPENFNYSEFCKALDAEIQKLHTAGIYHRDLHGGNVMIDANDGLPWIIDYGTAVHGTGGEMTYDEYASVYDPVSGRYEQRQRFYRDDLESVRKIKANLRVAEKRPIS